MTGGLARLGDVVEFINGGAWNQSEYADNGIPVVRVTNMRDGSIDMADCKFLPPEVLARYEKHQLHTGDLIIATVGSHPSQPGSVVGRPTIARETVEGYLLNQNAVIVRAIPERIDQGWLGCLGRTAGFREYIISCARGSANQVRMAIGLLKEMPVRLPSLPQQVAASSIISAYDDLIEVNQRRIAILENIARRLFEEWFICFRYPGHMAVPLVETELGLMPEGWQPRTLSWWAEEIRDAISPQQVDPLVAYVGLEHLPKRSTTLLEVGKAQDVISTKLKFEAGDILFGKIRPYFHKVALMPFSGVCSTDAICLRPINAKHTALVLCLVSSDAFVANAVATSNGTKMPRADWKVLKNYSLPEPPQPLLEAFERTVDPMVQSAANLAAQNNRLRAARDLLLPKLISGEIDVSLAEETFAEAAE